MLQSIAEQGVKAAMGECESCHTVHPSWALYAKADAVLCGGCLNATIGAEVPKAVIIQPWDTEQGKFLKAQRNLALDGSLWAVVASPLSAACQKEWQDYRNLLNRMTVDCADPAQWKWPKPPTPAYPAVSTTSTSNGVAVTSSSGNQTTPLVLASTSNSSVVKIGK